MGSGGVGKQTTSPVTQISFRPTNPDDIRRLLTAGASPAKFNKRGITSIRFLDIDALEAHF